MNARSWIAFAVGLLASTLAVCQESRPGPADLPALAIAAADGDLSWRREAIRSIARIFDAAGDESAASAPDAPRKAAARLRARETLAAKYGDVMRPHLIRGIDSQILGSWSAEALRSVLDMLWVVRVDSGKVVSALEGLVGDGADPWIRWDVIAALSAYDDGATAALMRLVRSGDRGSRGAALDALHSMGARARGAQEPLIDEFLATAPSSRSPDSARSAPYSRPSLSRYERLYLLDPLVSMGPAPEALTRRLLAAIEENRTENFRAVPIELLGILDPDGTVVLPWFLAVAREAHAPFADLAPRALGPGATGAVPELVHLLEDPRRSVVVAAVEALGSLGHAAREAAPALVHLHDARPPGLIGADADPIRTDLKRKIRRALVSIGTDSDILFLILSTTLTSEDASAVDEACEDLDRLSVPLPTADDLAVSLRAQGNDLQGHRAAYLIGRHGAAGTAAVAALAETLRSESTSLRYLAARSIEKIGPGAAEAARPLLMALHTEAQTIGPRPGENVAEINWVRINRQRDVSRRLVRALGAIGPAAREWVPAMKSALATVLGLDDVLAYEVEHESFDRIVPPERPRIAIVEDPSLDVKVSVRWVPGNRGSESRPFHADVSRDPDGALRLTLFDIRRPREFRAHAWTRALFLSLDPSGKLIATGELWRHDGGRRPTSKKEPPDLTSVRIRPVDLARAERLELSYDEDDQWVEVTVPNPFRK